MKKIVVDLKVRVTFRTNEDASIDEIMSNLGISCPSSDVDNTEVEDWDITDWEVADSR